MTDQPESSQIPFTPVTAEALARLTPAERNTFAMAAEQVASSQKPSMMTIDELIETIRRLITEEAPGHPAAAAPLTDDELDRLRRMVTDHEQAIAAVERALDLAAPLDDAGRGIIAAGREALKVLSGEEGEPGHG